MKTSDLVDYMVTRIAYLIEEEGQYDSGDDDAIESPLAGAACVGRYDYADVPHDDHDTYRLVVTTEDGRELEITLHERQFTAMKGGR